MMINTGGKNSASVVWWLYLLIGELIGGSITFSMPLDERAYLANLACSVVLLCGALYFKRGGGLATDLRQLCRLDVVVQVFGLVTHFTDIQTVWYWELNAAVQIFKLLRLTLVIKGPDGRYLGLPDLRIQPLHNALALLAVVFGFLVALPFKGLSDLVRLTICLIPAFAFAMLALKDEEAVEEECHQTKKALATEREIVVAMRALLKGMQRQEQERPSEDADFDFDALPPEIQADLITFAKILMRRAAETPQQAPQTPPKTVLRLVLPED